MQCNTYNTLLTTLNKKQNMDPSIEVIAEKDIKTYSLYDLPKVLSEFDDGDFFKINGASWTWELYEVISAGCLIRNTISKQLILIYNN